MLRGTLLWYRSFTYVSPHSLVSVTESGGVPFVREVDLYREDGRVVVGFLSLPYEK